MENTKTKAEVLAGVQASIGSIFTKEDVIGIINSIKIEGGKGKPSQKDLAAILEDLDLNSYIEKEVNINHSDIEFTYDSDDDGCGSFTVTAQVDDTSIENAVEVEVSLSDSQQMAQDILDALSSED